MTKKRAKRPKVARSTPKSKKKRPRSKEGHATRSTRGAYKSQLNKTCQYSTESVNIQVPCGYVEAIDRAKEAVGRGEFRNRSEFLSFLIWMFFSDADKAVLPRHYPRVMSQTRYEAKARHRAALLSVRLVVDEMADGRFCVDAYAPDGFLFDTPDGPVRLSSHCWRDMSVRLTVAVLVRAAGFDDSPEDFTPSPFFEGFKFRDVDENGHPIPMEMDFSNQDEWLGDAE